MPELKSDDRGAVATVFAILVAGGVLLGFLALVIDVGRIYVEREELRSGADAAALAVARACATSTVDCMDETAVTDLAQRFADDNASDRLADVVSVCGHFGDRVEPCPALAGNLTDCLGDPPGSLFVEVHLATEVTGDNFVLPPVFAATLTGQDDRHSGGTSVGACARAGWTVPPQLSTVALTVSDCEYAAATAGGYGEPAGEQLIQLAPGYPTCPTRGPGPWLSAGPAAWLVPGSTCESVLTPDGGLIGTVDPLPPVACTARLAQARDGAETVYLPVYDQVSTGLPTRTYHIAALAPFLVTGWQLGGEPASVVPSSLTPTTGPPCGDPAIRCVTGLFVGPPVALTDLGGTGAQVSLIG